METYAFSKEARAALGEKNARFLRTRTWEPVIKATFTEMTLGTFTVKHEGDAVELHDAVRGNHDGTTQVVRAWVERKDGRWTLRDLRWSDERL